MNTTKDGETMTGAQVKRYADGTDEVPPHHARALARLVDTYIPAGAMVAGQLEVAVDALRALCSIKLGADDSTAAVLWEHAAQVIAFHDSEAALMREEQKRREGQQS